MDLEERTRQFFAAHRDLRPDGILPFVAPDAVVEYVGAFGPMDRGELARMLAAMHGNLAALGMRRLEFRLKAVVVRRNVAFAEWSCHVERDGRRPLEHAGVHIIAWDRDGRLAHASVYTDPEPIRHLAVGWHAHDAVAP